MPKIFEQFSNMIKGDFKSFATSSPLLKDLDIDIDELTEAYAAHLSLKAKHKGKEPPADEIRYKCNNAKGKRCKFEKIDVKKGLKREDGQTINE